MARSKVVVALAVVAVVLATLLVGYLDGQALQAQQRQYCQQVHQFKLSGGTVGWPDYAGSYDAECVEGRVRNE